jgi:(p)ppGpp synthase/HD superfamily hydrolase
MSEIQPSFSPRLDRALRWAAWGHRDQVRKGSGIPYVQHVVAVAWILDRAGFDEDVVVAGLLHDIVEDTEVTLGEVEQRFGTRVAELVGHCSEIKLDDEGNQRPWIDRKRDHLRSMGGLPLEAKGIILADKLHNLMSIETDLQDGVSVWDKFNAPRDQVIWYQWSILERCAFGDDRDGRLVRLGQQCGDLLHRLESIDS